MQIQSLSIPKLKGNALFYCSKPQFLQLLQSPSPQEELHTMRSTVPFYKESTLRCVARALGLLALTVALLFLLFDFTFSGQWALHQMIVSGMPLLCFSFLALVWVCINGGALARVHCDAPQRKQQGKLILWWHVFYCVVFVGVGLFFSWETFLTGEFTASLGMDMFRVNRILNSAIAITRIVLLAAFLLSLIATVRVSVAYFTVSCHSLLLLMMLFLLLTTVLQDMSGTATVQVYAERLRIGFVLYAGMLAVFACVFWLYRRYLAKVSAVAALPAIQ